MKSGLAEADATGGLSLCLTGITPAQKLAPLLSKSSKYLENRLNRLPEISSHTEHQLRPWFPGALLQLRHKRTPHTDPPGQMRPRDPLAVVHL